MLFQQACKYRHFDGVEYFVGACRILLQLSGRPYRAFFKASTTVGANVLQ